MITGRYYKENLVLDEYDAIIIGSGIGGLTCARILSELGEKVLVLEKHYTAGGFTHTFTRKNYEWDTGVHYIGDVGLDGHPFRNLFDFLSSKNLQWSSMDEYYDEFIFPDRSYKLKKTEKGFKESLAESFSSMEDKQAILEYLKLLNQATKAGTDLCMGRSIPNFINSMSFHYLERKARKFSNLTTSKVLNRLTQNKKLQGVLTGQYANYGLAPKQSSFLVHGVIANHYKNGGFYPVGGGSSIARTIISEIEKNQGQVITRAGVNKIIINNKKVCGVKLENGRVLKAKKVISNAGLHLTMNKLIEEKNMSKQFLQEVKDLRYSSGYFSLNIGLKKSAEDLSLPRTNNWFFPSYDHDKNIENYFKNQSEEIPVSYVSFASAKDPSWSKKHPNKATIDILGASSIKWFDEWKQIKRRKSYDDYQNVKESMAKPYLEKLYQRYPQVKESLDYYEISTPLTVRDYCQYTRGEAYGLEPSPNRFTKNWLTPDTPIKGLYLTGQDMVFGGVCGALTSGAMTSLKIHPFKAFRLLKSIGFFDEFNG